MAEQFLLLKLPNDTDCSRHKVTVVAIIAVGCCRDDSTVSVSSSSGIRNKGKKSGGIDGISPQVGSIIFLIPSPHPLFKSLSFPLSLTKFALSFISQVQTFSSQYENSS